MKKISFIFGTRPEAIKLCPLILHMKELDFAEIHVCVTGQHRQMLDQVLNVFDVTPDFDMQLMRPNQTLAGLVSSAICATDEYIKREKPDCVIVQGDTNTVLAASLAAYYNHVKIAHVEAGLRTGNLYSPWPEEGNRLLTGHLANYHFCPTEASRHNLIREGIAPEKLFVTGNSVIDSLLIARNKLLAAPPRIEGLPDDLQLGRTSPEMVLITSHRRENFGSGFEDICNGIKILASENPGVHFVFPVHLNPNVHDVVYRMLGCGFDNIHLLPPQDYLPFVALMMRAKVIMSDSGGVQEEAPSLNKPVLVMRDNTERPEAVAVGAVKLIGSRTDSIVKGCSELLRNRAAYDSMTGKTNPYGDGRACERIAEILQKELTA